MLPIGIRLLSDVDRGERIGIGPELATVLRGKGLGILLEQERDHHGRLRILSDGVEGGEEEIEEEIGDEEKE